MNINDLTNKVMDNYDQPKETAWSNRQEVVFDPITAIKMGKIALDVFRTVRKCRKANQVKETAYNPQRRDQVILKRVVRKHLGWRGFRQNGQDVIKSLLKTGQGLTEEEIEGLYKQV